MDIAAALEKPLGDFAKEVDEARLEIEEAEDELEAATLQLSQVYPVGPLGFEKSQRTGVPRS